MRSKPEFLRICLTIVATILPCLYRGERNGCDAQTTDVPVKETRAVVLSTYLVLPLKNKRLLDAAKEEGIELAILNADETTTEQLSLALRDCEFLIIDTPHRSVAETIAARFADVIVGAEKKYVLVGELAVVASGETFALESLQSEFGVSAEWANRIRQYLRFGGTENTRSLVRALKGDFADDDLPEAIVLPTQGYYHPDWPTILAMPSELATQLQANVGGENREGASSAVVAIAVNGAVFTSEDTDWLDSLIAALQRRGLRAYAFFGPRQNPNLFFEMTRRAGGEQPIADLMINAALVFKPNERKAEFDRMDMPVIQTLPALAMDQSQWRASAEGLALVDISYYYTSSELAGMIDPLLISARDPQSGGMQPLEEQIDALAAKAASMIRLQRTPIGQRKIAMMVYNYPQGEGNFGASFLNVPKSVENILSGMVDAGYETQTLQADEITRRVIRTLESFYQPDLAAELLADNLAGTLSIDEYLQWFRQLPPETQARIEAYWGPADASAFVIPRVEIGRVVVMPQPLRHPVNASIDLGEKKNRIQHRSTVPLSHQYLATYVWLRREWEADALIHLGTHGTLEWSPGKERGLSVHDDPYVALGDLPNVYPYIMDNLGEAITAKRRGRAVIISHLTPMFSPAGFRPGLHEMHDLMHDWETVAPGPVRKELESRLLDVFVEHQLHRDLNWTEDEIAVDFERFIEELHPYLDDIAQSAQPQGLAAFGEVPTAERRFAMVMQMLRKPMIDALGEDIDEVFLLDSAKVLQSRPARWLRVALADPVAASKLDLRKEDAENSQPTSVPNRAESKVLDPAVLQELAERAQRLERELAKNEELEMLLKALDGKHIASSYGGDPVRNPESLPTGRNLYGFDPSRVPTRQAWDIGVDAFNEWLKQHQTTHEGQFPKKVAYSLWAGETMRHQGVMESQVLWAMGVKPVWDDAGRVKGLETIASSELGRPRIDVLLSVTGSYRDQFPLVMQWIDKAVQQIAAIDEPDNLVAIHTQSLKESFLERGIEDELAGKLAGNRLFSNESGGYGTGLSDAALATDVWANDSPQEATAEMAGLFIDRMGHAFGSGLDGASAGEAFAGHLSQVDAAMMSRTSNTYGVLTSDDPFQYLGGLSLAIKEVSGRSPALYVQNLRDESEVITDDAAVAIAKEANSRYLHPQWIRSQQAEGYSGTLQVLKSVQFLWGWQVMAPETVREDQWQSFYDVYLRDRYDLGTEKWLRESNDAALAQILERMLDAVRLNYWTPDTLTQQELVNAYLRSADQAKLIERNMAVTRFAQSQQTQMIADTSVPADVGVSADQAASNAPAPLPPAEEESNEVGTNKSTERVSGLKLEVADSATSSSAQNLTSWIWVVCIALMCFGGWRRSRQFRV